MYNNPINLTDPTGLVVAVPIIVILPTVTDIAIAAGIACLSELARQRRMLACARQRDKEIKQCRQLTDFRDQGKCAKNAGEREGQCNRGIPLGFRRPLFP